MNQYPKSEIWWDRPWNPATGCSKISAGCKLCYAERMTNRNLWGYDFTPRIHPERLDQPSRWRQKKCEQCDGRGTTYNPHCHSDMWEDCPTCSGTGKRPLRIFVCSMGDLFHEKIPGNFINEVWMRMFNCKKHTYLVLTKRIERALEWTHTAAKAKAWPVEEIWPSNVHLGVTVESQDYEWRIQKLLQVPAKNYFLSVEPMLSELDISYYLNGGPEQNEYHEWYQTLPQIGHVICGGETGPGAREMNPDYARSLRDQCAAARVPYFLKQMTNKAEVPEDLRIRQLPT